MENYRVMFEILDELGLGVDVITPCISKTGAFYFAGRQGYMRENRGHLIPRIDDCLKNRNHPFKFIEYVENWDLSPMTKDCKIDFIRIQF